MTEFAWGIDTRQSGAAPHCAGAGAGQRDDFKEAVRDVRGAKTYVGALVWFSVLDNHKEKSDGVKCQDRDTYWDYFPGGDPQNQKRAYEVTNTYGLFRRRSDGTLPKVADVDVSDYLANHSRLLLDAFKFCQANCQP